MSKGLEKTRKFQRAHLMAEIKKTFRPSDDPHPKMTRATLCSQLKALDLRSSKKRGVV